MSINKVAKDMLSNIEAQSEVWAKTQVPAAWNIRGIVTDIDSTGSLAKVQRVGQDYADPSFYPTLYPYFPRIGDNVLCGVLPEGIIVLGKINNPASAEIGSTMETNKNNVLLRELELKDPAENAQTYSAVSANWVTNKVRVRPYILYLDNNRTTHTDPTAWTTMYDYSVPAGALVQNEVLHVYAVMFLYTSGAARAFGFRLSFGGDVMYSTLTSETYNHTTRLIFVLDAYISVSTSVTADLFGTMYLGSATAASVEGNPQIARANSSFSEPVYGSAVSIPPISVNDTDLLIEAYLSDITGSESIATQLLIVEKIPNHQT